MWQKGWYLKEREHHLKETELQAKKEELNLAKSSSTTVSYFTGSAIYGNSTGSVSNAESLEKIKEHAQSEGISCNAEIKDGLTLAQK